MEATTDSPARTGSPGRTVARWVLVVVASLLLLLTILGVWVNRQILDTDNWVDTTDELLAEPEIQAAVATYVVDELYANVDVSDALADRLPDDLQGLAGPLSAALRSPATSAVERLLATGPVQATWSEANRAAHELLVKALEDDGEFVSTAGGTVTLDLGTVVVALGQDLGVPQSLLDRIPDDAGQIELVQSDDLALAQVAVASVRWAGLVFGVAAILLYAAAVWLSVGLRRRTLRNVGWAVTTVGLLVAAARRVSGNFVVDMVPRSDQRPAARAAYAIASDMLRQVAMVVVVWGLVLVVGCVVAGPTRPAVWVRSKAAVVLNRSGQEVAIVTAVVYLVLVLWAPVAALQAWLSVIGLAVVVGVGIFLLRRRTLVEFPDAALGGVGDTLDAVRGRLGTAWGSVVGTVRGRSGSSDEDRTAQLERLASLHERGALDDEEFARAKADLLGTPATTVGEADGSNGG
jgi:hypothetical protein